MCARASSRDRHRTGFTTAPGRFRWPLTPILATLLVRALRPGRGRSLLAGAVGSLTLSVMRSGTGRDGPYTPRATSLRCMRTEQVGASTARRTARPGHPRRTPAGLIDTRADGVKQHRPNPDRVSDTPATRRTTSWSSEAPSPALMVLVKRQSPPEHHGYGVGHVAPHWSASSIGRDPGCRNRLVCGRRPPRARHERAGGT